MVSLAKRYWGSCSQMPDVAYQRDRIKILIVRLLGPIQLDLIRNRLSALPPEIARLTALEGLYLSGNRLSALPPEIGQLTALRYLSVSCGC
jgi:Leucine rich repeat